MTSAKFSLSADGAPGTEVVAASTLQPAIVAAIAKPTGIVNRPSVRIMIS
jgi:hypothetical protein